MHILILGSGGREHTFAHKIAESNNCSKLFVAPGNAGTAEIAINYDLDPTDFETVKKLVLAEQIEMLIVGPEAPLVKGIYDFFQDDKELRHVNVIGPSKRGALLEGSKERAKEFMGLYNVPTAAYNCFTVKSLDAGKKFLEELESPYVLKADGLAAGKGVVILEDLDEAKEELEQMLTHQKFGAASEKVVIEEFLDGIELSVFVLTDGENYITLPTAKDYKRIGEGDTGLNTGGMGAVSPVSFADAAFMQKVEERVIKPTIKGLKEEQIDYKGFIFIGLIKIGDDPYVIEYNVRMGDPETEAVLPRIKNDLVEVFTKVGQQKLNEVTLDLDERAAATIVLVAGGYPENYEKGKVITGIENVQGAQVFQAGTRLENKDVVTAGGRVLAVTALDVDFKQALNKAYTEIEKISFEGMNYRKDIGFDL
jgi:phosphoribosylamine--glycine ligase